MIDTEHLLYPLIRQTDDEDYALASPFTAKSYDYVIAVLDGFKYDGFSVPILFHWFQSPFTGVGTPAALIHDALYASELVTRKTADLIFRDLLKKYGVGVVKRNILYQAVRRFGWYTYNGHSAEAVEEARRFVKIETT
jgi:hypothetical protein